MTDRRVCVYSRVLCDGYSHNSTSIRRPFDGRSTADQVIKVTVASDPLAAVTLSYLCI